MGRATSSTDLLQRLGDPSHTLPGENPTTASLQDARHWAATYEKLIEFQCRLLDLVRRHAEASDPDVAKAIRETDLIVLEMQMARLAQRRDYWTIRARELEAAHRAA